jgi:DNA-binding transcriptional MerR regulator
MPSTTSKLLTIGALASRSGLSRDTIRFYEREALLPQVPRNNAGYRLYSAAVLERLHFIKQAQALGFSLAVIRDLLKGYQDPEECQRVRQLLTQKIAELDQRMRDMQALRDTLSRYQAECQKALRDGQASAACPVLTRLREA